MSPSQRRRAWLALWAQNRRRGRIAEVEAEPSGLFADLVGYWDGDSELDATNNLLLLPEEAPAYSAMGGPGGGPSCALGESDFVYSEDEAFFNFAAMTYNVWVNQNEDFGVETLSTRTTDLNLVCVELFVALDMQAVFGGHMYSETQWESPPEPLWFPHPVGTGEWHMWTITMSESRLDYYVDGEWFGGVDKLHPTRHHPTAQFRVKGNHPWGWWTGAWANLGLWHRALAAEEVAALYNEGNGRTYSELL